MRTVLFIGGPLHLRKVSVPDDRFTIVARAPDPHNEFLRPVDPLADCLELREIEALTGRSHHRDPGRPLLEDMERRHALEHIYHLRVFYSMDRVARRYFVDAAPSPSELDEIMRTLNVD